MEDLTYPFEKEINLNSLQKNNESICLAAEKQEASQKLNIEKDLQSLETETIPDRCTKQSNQNDEDLNINISSFSPAENLAIDGIKSEYENPEDLFQAEHIIPMVEIKQESSFRGSGRLVRLQAAPDPSAQPATSIGSEVKVANDKVETVNSESLKINASQLKGTSTSQAPIHSMSDYQFLTPKIPPSKQQVPVSSSNQFTTAQFQSNFSSNQSCSPSITSYESTPINRFGVPHTDNMILRYDKVPSHSSSDGKISRWILNSSSSCDSSSSPLNMSNDSSFQFPVNDAQEPSPIFSSSPGVDENSSQMQRFLTADNKVVYGYKDSSGEFHFFCNNERESHNEKERKRRSRVSESCSALRKLIPGLSDKTDKATVFEQAASYLKFLREKFGMQFDQSYCEKYFQERT